MKLKESIPLILALLISFISILSGQKNNYELQLLDVKDGLPQRSVYEVAKDRSGYIWCSIQGGVCRFDGYRFKTYDASFLGTTPDIPPLIAVDKFNRIWYCQKSYILNMNQSGILNTVLDSVLSVESISGGLIKSADIVSLCNGEFNSDEILICTADGVVYKYDGNFTKIFELPEKLRSVSFYAQTFSEDIYWITVNDTIYKVEKGKSTDQISTNVPNINRLFSNSTGLIFQSIMLSSELIEAYFSGQPLSGRLDSTGDLTAPFLNQNTSICVWEKTLKCTVENKEIIIEDPFGKTTFQPMDYLRDDYGSDFYISSATRDDQGIIWICSNIGLIKIATRENPFETIYPGNSIRGIYKNEDGLWLGSYTKNLIWKNQQEAPVIVLPDVPFPIVGITKGKQGNLWMTIGGFYLELDSIGTVKTIGKNDHVFFSIFYNPYTENILLGTQRSGLFLHKKEGPVEIPLSIANPLAIRSFYQNASGIWLASNQGIILLDNNSETLIKHYTKDDGLPFELITHIHEDKDGIFWLGTTDGGLIRWNRQQNTYRQFTMREGLSNNTIYAVYGDDFGNLWLPSNYGLMRFEKETFLVNNFLSEDGIAHEEFNFYAHYQAPDGTLYYGGLNGVTKFHPKNLQGAASSLPIKVERVNVLEKDAIDFIDKTDQFNSEQKISLFPGDRILRLSITILDYVNPSDNKYAYKIEGFQESWVYTQNPQILITKPGYGNYRLKIKGKGASSNWSDEILDIPLYVAKPFYLQNWFLTLVAILFFTGLIFFIKWRLTRLEKQQVYLESEVKNRTEIIEKDKQTILEQSESLKELDKVKTRFFSNITHEIRTPLTLIKGPVEQLIEEYPTDTKLQKRLSSVASNANHLLGIINQLLDISKLESGQMHTKVMHGDLIGYTRELVDRFRDLANEKKIVVEVNSIPEFWEINFDTDKWNKIIYNLLSNAIKFTPSGGKVELTLRKTQKEGKEFIHLLVKDSGIGIKADQLGKIFDRFYQTDDSATRVRGGTGIGLSLVKELVDLIGGKVEVFSQPGEGTTFKIILPVIENSETKAEFMKVPEVSSNYEHPTPKMETEIMQDIANTATELEILIIEDNAEIRAYIKSLLDLKKYHISEASDGKEGLKKALDQIPDLIISDVMMPEMNGFEVLKTIRNNPISSHIPVVLLTAKASLDSRIEGFRSGADAYLAKPFSPQELRVRIRNLLEQRRLLQERYSAEIPKDDQTLYRKEDDFIIKIRTFILDNINVTKLNGDVVGKHLHISRAHLHRKLKALTNKSISEFVKEIRLQKSMELIQEGKWNISEITYKTGFSSISHFSRTFKNKYGKAPSEM